MRTEPQDSFSARQDLPLFFAVLLTRLPWISTGYGSDADAYRVVNAARRIIEEGGAYTFSRPPGYPVYEYAVASLVAFGPIATNFLSAVSSAVAAVLFVRILREVGVRAGWLEGLAFACVPVVYINSVTTMDYLPALALILGAALSTLQGRVTLAGVLMGLAIGVRITSGAVLIPLSLWLIVSRSGRFQDVLRLWIVAGGVAFLCYIPVGLGYGISFLSYASAAPTIGVLVAKGTVAVWGTIGFLAVCALAIAAGLALRRPQHNLALPLAILCGSTVAIYVCAFLALPHEPGYLIPMVPFLLLLLLATKPRGRVVVLSALALSSLVLGVDRSGLWPEGPIWLDHQHRTVREELVVETQRLAPDLPQNSTVVAGWYYPDFVAAGFEHSLTPKVAVVSVIRNLAGVDPSSVYFLPEIDEYNVQSTGVDIRSAGAVPLDVPNPRAARGRAPLLAAP